MEEPPGKAPEGRPYELGGAFVVSEFCGSGTGGNNGGFSGHLSSGSENIFVAEFVKDRGVFVGSRCLVG